MKVTIGEAGLGKSWQAEFPKTTTLKCKCGGEARIAFVAHEGLDEDDRKELRRVYNLHSNEGKGGYWLHDCCAVAVYFCRDCAGITALYNQA